jgi:hypothetical protein
MIITPIIFLSVVIRETLKMKQADSFRTLAAVVA